jgi:predicted dinucleotide-binding enzyme
MALALAEKLVKGRALDVGPLASSRALENMCAVIVNLNRRYGGHGGLQIVGL